MSVSALIINLPSSQPPSVEPRVLQCVSIAKRMVGAQPLRAGPLGAQHLATGPLRAQPLGTRSQPLRTGPLGSQPLEPQPVGNETLGTGPLGCWEIVQTPRREPLPAIRSTSRVDVTVEHNVGSFRLPCCLDSLSGWKFNGFPRLAWAELLFTDSIEFTLSGGMNGFAYFHPMWFFNISALG